MMIGQGDFNAARAAGVPLSNQVSSYAGEVRHLLCVTEQDLADLAIADFTDQLDAAESDAVVRSGVLDDFVAGRTEERRLGAEDLVLATSLLIVIVDAEDSHVYAACRTGSRQVGRRLAAC